MRGGRLCVFARYPVAGLVKTRLIPPLDPAIAAALYRAFLLDALDSYSTLDSAIETVVLVADPADLDRFTALLDEEKITGVKVAPQAEGDLGTRLASAFADGFASGCTAVCAIGTDHPTLQRSSILDAFNALGSHDLSLGPADDGGYYLLAARGYHPGLFEGIAWSTDAVARQTLDRAESLGLTVALLPAWYDVDHEADLRRLVGERHLLSPESRTARMIEESEALKALAEHRAEAR